MIRIQEAILVEGKYDKNVLSQIVDTSIFETGGFRIMKDPEKIAFLSKVAEKRGLILLLDSDGAGFVIRNRLKGILPPDRVLHAYIPEIPGKEKRKEKPGKAGLLGVEGMTPEIIMESLRRCGAHFDNEEAVTAQGAITRADLYSLGLMGTKNSAQRRDEIKKALSLPSGLGTSAFLDALNLVTDLDTLYEILNETEKS